MVFHMYSVMRKPQHKGYSLYLFLRLAVQTIKKNTNLQAHCVCVCVCSLYTHTLFMNVCQW